MTSLERELERLFSPWDRSDRPGCTVAVVKGGTTLLRRGYGMASLDLGVPNRPETVIRIGSQTKQMTVFLAWLLIDDGRLAYDDDIRKFHGDLPKYDPKVTVGHVMANVGGLREFLDLIALSGADSRSPISAGEISALIRGQASVNFAPGERLMYCNSGFRLLSEIVEKITGEDIGETMRKKIFEPLGMGDTRLMRLDDEIVPGLATHHLSQPDGSFKKGRWGVPIGGEGGAVSTVDDMLKWSEALVAEKPKAGSAKIFAAMAKPPRFASGKTSVYAHGLQSALYRGAHGIGHGGGVAGGRSGTYQFPQHRLTVCILGNLDSIGPFVLSRRIADLCLGEALTPLPRPPSAAELERLTGLYLDEARGELLELAVEDGVLHSVLGNKTPLWQLTPGVFVPMSGVHDHEYRFAHDGRSVEAQDSGRPVRYRRLDPVVADPKSLAEVEGSYANAGLETEYRIEQGREGLDLTLEGALGRRRMRFKPVAKEMFVASIDGPRPWGGDFQPVLHFARNAAGRIDGIRVSTDRNKKIPFLRRN
jgi:CubicO group peptidase (beta-lactamase class C family)